MKISHVLAFVGGIFAGAAAGILFAPDKGSNTRQKIVDLLKEKGIILSKEELNAFIEKVKSKLKNGFTSDEIDEAVEDAIKEENIA